MNCATEKKGPREFFFCQKERERIEMNAPMEFFKHPRFIAFFDWFFWRELAWVVVACLPGIIGKDNFKVRNYFLGFEINGWHIFDETFIRGISCSFLCGPVSVFLWLPLLV